MPLNVVVERLRIGHRRANQRRAWLGRRREGIRFRQEFLLGEIHDQHVTGMLVAFQEVQLDRAGAIG